MFHHSDTAEVIQAMIIVV